MIKWSVLFLTVMISMAFVVPKDFDYYYKKGFVAIEEGNNSAAIYYLDSAIALNIHADSAFSLIAYPYYLLGKTEKAIEYSNRAIELNSENAFAYYVRGLTHTAIDIVSDSLVKLVKKHRKDSSWMASNFFNRYYIAEPEIVQYSGIFDYGEVIEDFNRSIKLNPNYAQAYADRAYCHECLMQFEQAKADYNKSIELRPNNPYYYLNRGRFQERYGIIGSAMDDYTTCVELDSTISEAYYRRGLLYYNIFDKEYACKDLTKATLLGWYVENLNKYCAFTALDSVTMGSRNILRHDYVPCVCPNPEKVFNPEVDTIKEVELMPGIKQKIIDIKDSEKTTWEFDDGRIIEISKETKRRWLKEQELKRKKEQEKTRKSNTIL